MQKSYVHRQECQNGGSRILTFLSSVKLCLNVNRNDILREKYSGPFNQVL